MNAYPPNAQTTCTGGTLTAVAGGSEVSYSDDGEVGLLSPSSACTITVDVTSAIVDTYTINTVAVISSLGTSDPAQATLTVNVAEAPGFTRVFAPDTIAQGEQTKSVFTIDNGVNLIEITGLAFNDTLPNGVTVATTPGATACNGGTLTAVAGSNTISFTGGTLAAGASCEILLTVQAIEAGERPGPEVSLTSSAATAIAATAPLTVNEAPSLTASMAFDPVVIRAGGVSRLTYTLENIAAIGATAVALSDTLPADVVFAADPAVQNTCVGALTSPVAGATALDFTGGTLGAGESCMISVNVTSTVVDNYPNPTESVTSSLGASDPAQATLTVDAADAPVFTRVFAPDTIRQGEETEIVFNIVNAIEITGLAFNDTLPNGVTVVTTPGATACNGGTLTAVAGSNTISLTGGVLAAGETCTIRVTVQATRAGTLTAAAITLASSVATATAAEATLTVNEIPLSVSMEFDPATIARGGISTLRYKLENSATIGATEVALSDTLPANVVLADPFNANDDCGGTLTAVAGGSGILYSDGALAAGAECTIAVDVTSATADTYTIDTVTVTSSLGVSTPAEATLTVDPAAPPGFTRVFSPDRVDPGQVSTLTFTIDNGANLIDVGSLAFTDVFPLDLVVADDPAASTTCGGVFAPAASATALVFTGGSVAAGQSCTISVDVRGLRAIALTGTSSDLTSDLPVATPGASATLTVNEAPLSVSISFQPPAIRAGGVSRLTYELRNEAAVGASLILLSDTLPADVVVADPPNAQTTCTGGVLTAVAGGSEVSYSDDGEVGLLSPSSACTITVDVTSATAGSYSNDTESVISSLGVSTPAPATLMVDEAAPLSVSMAFEPTAIRAGGVSRLSYTLSNGALIGATAVTLSDTLPVDMVLASDPDASTSCSGALTAPAGGNTITFTGGVLAAEASCRLAVNVTSVLAGTYLNETESVTSSLGDSAIAAAMLTVDAADAPVFTRVFVPDTIRQGGETEVVFTIDNSANATGITAMTFDDVLSAGVSVAATPGIGNSCGGTFSPDAGDTVLSFADGVLAAGATCEIRVTVRAITAGTLTGPDVALTSSLATATAAEATLDVTAADAPGFTKMFLPATVDPGQVSTLTFTIDNGANLIDVGSLAFTDVFPVDLIVADDPAASPTCGGVFAPAASATALAFTGGSVAAGQSCTISVDVRGLRAASLTGASGDLTSDLPVATPGASATLTVNEVPLSVSMAFQPTTIRAGGVSRLSYTLSNGALIGATAVTLSDSYRSFPNVIDFMFARATASGFQRIGFSRL